jgi:hypothetical protein
MFLLRVQSIAQLAKKSTDNQVARSARIIHRQGSSLRQMIA